MEVSAQIPEVFKDRVQLDELVEKFQSKVKLGLYKLEEIRELTEKLKEHEEEIRRNQDFQITVTTTECKKTNIDPNTYVTNCQVCHFTCHYPCRIPKNEEKRGCSAMNDGECTVCPAKCVWNFHYNSDYKWEYETVTRTQTLVDIKNKYEAAKGAKASVEAVIRRLEQEYMQVQLEVLELIDKSTACLNRLSQITLSPDSLSAAEYVERMIQGEREASRPGWQRRVNVLVVIRQRTHERKRTQQRSVDLGSYCTVLLLHYCVLLVYLLLRLLVGGADRGAGPTLH